MILITGSAGFIGFHLTLELLKKNYKILGVDNLNSYYDKTLKQKRLKILNTFRNFKFLNIDIKKYDLFYKKIYKKKIDTLIHLAAQPGVRISIQKPYNTLTQNLNSFSNVIEIVRILKIKKFIYASSSSVYGDAKKFPFNESDKYNVPVSIYGATKLCNEIIAESYVRNFKIQAIGLRFFTVYGPFGRPDMAYYSFMNNLMNNRKIKVFNKGNMLRDFTYIDDIIDGIKKILTSKKRVGHLIINLGKGKPDKLFDLIELIEKFSHKKFKIQFTKSIPNGDIKKTFANINKAKNLIKWKPKTNLKQGLSKFTKWYLDYHEVK
tara:strand:+ start:86 stop:1048 length:963 start_codon:yes stop_codon:yes gene_type:complete